MTDEIFWTDNSVGLSGPRNTQNYRENLYEKFSFVVAVKNLAITDEIFEQAKCWKTSLSVA